MEAPAQTVSRWKHALALAILASGVLLAYANSFTTGFARDSPILILQDERVHRLTRQNVRDILQHNYAWPAFASGLYRPVSTLSYLFNYAVLDNFDRPAGYHWVNYLLHAANAFWVYLLAFTLARRYGPAVLAGLLWALHPVATEAVTNIAGRPEELAGWGVLAALVLYILGREACGWRNCFRLAGITAAATVAVFSKESGVAVLPLAVFYDLVLRARRDWKGYICLGLPVAAMLAVRWQVLRHEGVMELPWVNNPIAGAGFLAGRATAIGVLGKYLWLLLWPQTLACDYSYNQIPVFQWHSMTWQQWISVAAVAGLAVLAAACYRRHRTACFLLGFSAIAMLPAANLLVPTGTVMAERLLYLPSVGFATAVSLGIYKLAGRLRLRPPVAAAALVAVGTAYGARTYLRNPDWRNNETLFASAIEAVPDNFEPHLALAEEWYTKDPTFLQGDRAVIEAERSAELVRNLPDNRVPTLVLRTLGAIYCARGDLVAGKDADGNPRADSASSSWYYKALDVDLRAVAANRAADEERRQRELARGTPPEAIGVAGLPDIYANLGNVYLRLGESEKAREAYLTERRFSLRSSGAYLHLAAADRALGKPEDAATAVLEAYIFDKSQAMLELVAKAYTRIPDGGCAVDGQPGRRGLNQECPLVQRDLCRAYTDLEQAFREGGKPMSAGSARESARQLPGCR